MKKYYILIVILTIVGIVASLFVIPGKKEVALMNLKDKRFEEAKTVYLQELAKGKDDVSVISPLVDLLLQDGNVNDAIDLMEKFVEKHPNNIEARKRLGLYYQYAQRQDDYLRNLEEINRLNPTAQTQKDLADIYNYKVDYAKQIEILKGMVKNDPAVKPQVYIDLASLLATQKEYEDAVAILQELRTKHPEAYTYDQLELQVSLLADLDRKEDAYKLAAEWLAAKPEPKQIAQIANVLHYKGRTDLAYKLITPYEEKAYQSGDLLDILITIYNAQGQEEKSYEILSNLYDNGKLPAKLYAEFIDFSLAHGNSDIAYQAAENLDPMEIEEQSAASLVELALANNDRTLMQILIKKFNNQDYLLDRPFLTAILALATHSPRADDYVAVLESKTPLLRSQMFEIGEVCGRVGNRKCATHYIEKLKAEPGLNDIEIAGVGRLYVFNRQYAEGYSYINEYRQLNDSTAIEEAWVILAAATGKQYEVETWLENTEHKDPSLLRDLYYLSSDNKYYALAASIAETLKTVQDTPETDRLLALAYVHTGRYEAALPILRETRNRSDEDKSAYITALGKLAGKNATLRKELIDYVSAELKDPKITQKRKMEIVYTLIDAGATEQVLPIIRQYALSSGGSWASLYQEQLTKHGKTKELHDFLITLANKSGISDTEKRAIAYSLLDQGYREEATGLFKSLADRSAPDSENVNTLLYLWGPRPDATQMAWIVERAASATNPAEKAKWVNILADSGGDLQLLQLVDADRNLLQNPGVATAYLEALGRQNNREELRKQIALLTMEQSNPDVLRKFAQAAIDHYELKTARSVYEKVLEVKPGDLDAMLNIGILSHGQADYPTAKAMLSQYLTLREGQTTLPVNDYQAPYYYAEMLQRDKDPKKAAEYYQATIDLLAPLSPKTVEMQSIAATARFHTGDKQAAIDEFRQLVNDHPDNRVLRADFISLLVDNKQYDDAINIANAAPNVDTPADTTWEVVALDNHAIRDYAISADQREILVRTNSPAEALAKKMGLNYQNPAGIAYTSTGYDSLLFTARENSILIAQTDSSQFHVFSEPTARVMDPRLEEQIDIRMELLYARIELETGHDKAAIDRLNVLTEHFPEDAQVLGYAANAHFAAGSWRRAQTMIDKAKLISPENEDIAILDRDIRRAHAPNIKADYEWRSRGDSNEHIATLSGFAYVRPYLQLGAEVVTNWVRGKNVRRADGRLGNFSDTKQYGEVYLSYDFANASNLRGSIYGNNDTMGLGGEYSFLNSLGRSSVLAEYHRPYDEYVEGILDDSTRDRVAVGHTAKLRNDIVVSGETGLNRYNVDSDEDVASTYSLAASIVKQLKQTEKYSISAGYGLDAEYLIDSDKKVDAIGDYYRPFPVISREVHSINLFGRYDFSDRLFAEGLLGYGYDRLGGHGPSVEAELTYLVTEQWEAQVRAAHSQGYGAFDGNIDRVGAYLMWKH